MPLNQYISTSKNKDYEIWLKEFIHNPIVKNVNKMEKVSNLNSIENKCCFSFISNNQNYKPPLEGA